MSSALSGPAASAAVEPFGWRLLLLSFGAHVEVSGLGPALAIGAAAVAACGVDADQHLRVDLRPDRVEFVLQDRALGDVTDLDAELAGRITAAVAELGFVIAPATAVRPVQSLEIAVDALDIPAVRPFWKAVLALEDEPGAGPTGPLVDPARQHPPVWFQQMDAPRPQRNRLHLDVTVPHDEAERRVRAALEAGGVLVSDAHARSFWVLADAEGNEVCVCTWQDRDG